LDTKVKGIVLKSIDFKDNDKLLTILTLEKGKITVKARGVKKNTSSYSYILTCSVVGSGYFSFFPLLLLLLILLLLLTLLKLFFKIYFLIEG